MLWNVTNHFNLLLISLFNLSISDIPKVITKTYHDAIIYINKNSLTVEH